MQASAPLYIQIAEELRHNIEQSVYPVGGQLPTEAELSTRFGVNRHTLRRAIEVLRNEGLVRVDRGRGSFVAAAPIAYTIGKKVRYTDTLKAQGFKPTIQNLRVVDIPADQAIAQKLAIALGESVILLERLSFADEIPISVASSHFPAALFPNLIEHCSSYHSVSKMLQQEYNCDHIRRSTRISARCVQPRDARLLGLAFNAPILLSESINVDQQGRIIEYGLTRFRGDRMELVFENDE
ncbi:MAG: phosphonate metabolism transcriptional regulator PhnF [Oculatellaceae cyanobacterium Prado106]|jgi:GntR family phosphonate transport system transcriptional regulator|nr:phosphonate metabolism transcriptional regulator PhnF [Oculatellaceae cyanobacterium Prado106]